MEIKEFLEEIKKFIKYSINWISSYFLLTSIINVMYNYAWNRPVLYALSSFQMFIIFFKSSFKGALAFYFCHCIFIVILHSLVIFVCIILLCLHKILDRHIRNYKFHYMDQYLEENTLSQNKLKNILKCAKTEKREICCAICRENIKLNNGKILLTVCNHYFHEDCLVAWLQKGVSFTCPLCRAEIKTNV